MPKISVIMPVHNEPENFLRTAINSILKQTFDDFEFIIINDASENNAEDVILSYDDSRIRYYKNETNLKVIETLNRGLELANGDYIARMDADDISLRRRFEVQVQLLDDNEQLGVVNSYCYMFPAKRLVNPPQEPEDIEFMLKYCANCILHPAVMIRKSILDEHGLKYSHKYIHAEDYNLWVEMTNYTQFFTVPEYLIMHRAWSNSVSKQNEWEQYYNAQIISFEAILKDLNIQDDSLPDIFKNQLKLNTISESDFLKLDKVYTQALQKCYESTNPIWHNYLMNAINQKRNNIFNRIEWC